MSQPAYANEVLPFTTNALDSLASSTTFLVGKQCAVIDNTTTKYIDFIMSGKFKSHGSSNPTVGQIQVWAGALLGDSAYPDAFTASEGSVTVTTAAIRNAALKLAMVIDTDATQSRIYPFTGICLAPCFNGILPPKMFLWVTHSMVQTLNGTAGAGGTIWLQGITAP